MDAYTNLNAMEHAVNSAANYAPDDFELPDEDDLEFARQCQDDGPFGVDHRDSMDFD